MGCHYKQLLRLKSTTKCFVRLATTSAKASQNHGRGLTQLSGERATKCERSESRPLFTPMRQQLERILLNVYQLECREPRAKAISYKQAPDGRSIDRKAAEMSAASTKHIRGLVFRSDLVATCGYVEQCLRGANLIVHSALMTHSEAFQRVTRTLVVVAPV
jgi:hypothetical protein